MRGASWRAALILMMRMLAIPILIAGYALCLGGQNQTGAREGGSSHAQAPDAAAAERGKSLFAMNCSFCHGANAKGGEGGPDLLRSLVVLDDEKGERIGAVVLEGRTERGMPKFALSGDQMTDLVAFLHRQVQAATAFQSYKVLNIVVGDAKAGEAYFHGAGQCGGCHSVTGDLAHIGSKYPPVDLQQKFIMPRGDEGSAGHLPSEGAAMRARVSLASGEVVEGRLEAIDDFNVVLIDAKGARRTFSRDGDVPRIELHDPLQRHAELLKRYTDADIHNLTAYLVTLQ
jgi:cytochrome c oxidase cbb3-type subunit 3